MQMFQALQVPAEIHQIDVAALQLLIPLTRGCEICDMCAPALHRRICVEFYLSVWKRNGNTLTEPRILHPLLDLPRYWTCVIL